MSTESFKSNTSFLTLEQIEARVNELPTLPAIVYELNKIITDPMSSVVDVEKVMANDPSLTAQVLKLANSAYYAIPGGVSSLSRAIAYIGFDSVQQLVLATSIIKTLKLDSVSKTFDINEFWKHSMGVAMASETIAKHLNHQAQSDIFTAGLLHDLGKMALFIIDNPQLEELSKFALDNETNIYQAEKELKLISHSQLGMILTKKWKLPNKLQSVAQYHHEDLPENRGNTSSELNEIVDIVILANLLIHALNFGASGHKKVLGVSKPLMERLQIDGGDIKKIVASIKKALESAEAFLQIIGD